MPPYEFLEYASLTAAQVQQVRAIERDPNNPLPVGFHEPESLFGYIDQATQDVVAWAWGTTQPPQGDLHLIVLPAHRQATLGTRLALRYLLTVNPIMTDFEFAVTNDVLVRGLQQVGFAPHDRDPRTYVREQFAGPDLIDLKDRAQRAGALERIVSPGAATSPG